MDKFINIEMDESYRTVRLCQERYFRAMCKDPKGRLQRKAFISLIGWKPDGKNPVVYVTDAVDEDGNIIRWHKVRGFYAARVRDLAKLTDEKSNIAIYLFPHDDGAHEYAYDEYEYMGTVKAWLHRDGEKYIGHMPFPGEE